MVGNIGDVEQETVFKINDNIVKTYKGGAFVYVVPLEYGENNFELKTINSEKTDVVNFKLYRPAPNVSASQQKNSSSSTSPAQNELEVFNDFIVAEVVKDNSPLRTGADDNSRRVAHLDKSAILLLDAKKGQYYRVYANENTKYWIKNGYFTEVSKSQNPINACLKHFKYSYDKQYEYFSFKTDMSVPYEIQERENGLFVRLYYVSAIPDKLEKYVKDIKFESNTLSFFVPQQKLWGYDFIYDDSKMTLKLARQVKTDTHCPLKNLVIAIDAGHGGRDGGAIGPTRIREADIVLDISQRLEKILSEQGAKVVMTRSTDEYVDLYKRVEIIRAANPTFSISIHANALPDGADPYIKYGTSVFYYYPQSKELAETIKQYMIGGLNTRDDGTNYASFVLTRISAPLSVLVEVAYMINPYEYENLIEPVFRQKVAQSIADGLKAYINASVAK